MCCQGKNNKQNYTIWIIWLYSIWISNYVFVIIKKNKFFYYLGSELEKFWTNFKNFSDESLNRILISFFLFLLNLNFEITKFENSSDSGVYDGPSFKKKKILIKFDDLVLGIKFQTKISKFYNEVNKLLDVFFLLTFSELSSRTLNF